MTTTAAPRARVDYVPNPRQALAHATLVDELLYGGAAGGGKSRFARMEALAFACQVPGSATLILRKTFPDLNRAGGMIPMLRLEVPRELGTYNGTAHIWTLRNGSTIELGYLRTDADVVNYQGAEYQLIIVDEVTQQTEYRYRYLLSRLRAAGPLADRLDAAGLYPRMIATGNPGGVGHAWVKGRWIDPAPPEQPWRPPATLEDSDPGVRCFIPAKVTDNTAIDAGYLRKLNSLPDDERRALRDGDWDVYAGQRFRGFRRDVHVIEPEDLPLSLGGIVRAVGVDYGLDAPYAALWGARLADGLIVVYREDYRAGLTPDEQAASIVALEAPGERDDVRPVPVALDPSTWARNPHVATTPKGPGTLVVDNTDPQAPPPGSIADAYRKHLGTAVVKAHNDRLAGVALIADKLRVRADGLPRLLIYSTCRNLIRTLPALPRDTRRPEDVDTSAEDHCLTGSTLVDTTTGPRRIDSLVGTTGTVQGIDGPVPYFDVRLMRRDAPLVTVTLDDGRAVTCTTDHKVMTPAGWRHAADLRSDDMTLSVTIAGWTPSPSAPPFRSTPAAATTYAAATSNTTASDSTAASTSTTTATPAQGGTSTTTTTTATTTPSPTSNPAASTTTSPTTPPTPPTPSEPPAQTTPSQPPQGTPSFPPSNAPKPPAQDGTTSPSPRSHASSVATSTALRSRVARAIAEGRAAPARVVDVSPAGSADVYDLAVEDPSHAFTVNGGIVVSNCYDALRYLVNELERHTPPTGTPAERAPSDRLHTGTGTATGRLGGF